MYVVGQLLQGERYNEFGQMVVVTGTYLFTTDDPEEYIQDVVLEVPGAGPLYFDEQDVRPVIYL